MREHEEIQMPGPPLGRQLLAVAVLVLGLGVFMGWIPFGVTTMSLALVLIGAALIV